MNPVSLSIATLVALFLSISGAFAQFKTGSPAADNGLGGGSRVSAQERRSKISRRANWRTAKFSHRRVASTTSSQWSTWKTILRQRYPNRFDLTVPAEEMIEDLRQIGLPIVLDETAIDDSLDEDVPISLPLPDTPLEGRLFYALKQKNATFCFKRDHILIFSLDDYDDPSYLMTVTYDISRMGLFPEDLIDTVQSSIEPDSWQDTGTGEGTIVHLYTRGHDLMIVSTGYRVHRAIEELLGGIDHLTGGKSVRNIRSTDVGTYTTSTHTVAPRTNSPQAIFPTAHR